MSSAVNSLRNVISTRSPICKRVDVDVGELDREAAAAVEVDDRERDRRARRVCDAVDREQRDRALAPPTSARAPCRRPCRRRARSRAGGRCSSSLLVVAGADERVLPLLAAARHRRRDALGLGAPGRLERDAAAPREELAVGERRRRWRPAWQPSAPARYDAERVGGAEQQHVDAVGEHDERDHLAGLGGLERVREQQRGVRGAGVADRRREVVGHGGLRRAEAPGDAAHRARVHAGDDELVDLVGVELGRLRARAFHACSTSGAYLTSPKRSSHARERREPGARQRSMNSSVALAAAEVLGDHGAVVVGADDAPRRRRRRPAPRRRSWAGRRAGRRRRRARDPLPSSAARSAPTPERSAPPKSNAATSVSSRSAAWIADALFLSR